MKHALIVMLLLGTLGCGGAYNIRMPIVKKKPVTVVENSRKAARARAAKLTPKQRSQIARKAARARWAKTKSQ